MGELHLEIIVDRMKREFNVDANVGRPQVAYKETIMGEADGEGKYIKQSGGRGQYGHAKVRVRPLERGAGFVFLDEIKGGSIPKEFINPTEKGVKEAVEKGIVAGYPVVDVEVTLYDGSFHEVDSSEAAFKIAGSMAFQDAAKKAKPVILEPIMKIQVIVPENYMGEVTGNVNSKRGRIESMEDRPGLKVINALIPAFRNVRLCDGAPLHDAGPRFVHDGIRSLRARAEQRGAADHRRKEALIFAKQKPQLFSQGRCRNLLISHLSSRRLRGSEIPFKSMCPWCFSGLFHRYLQHIVLISVIKE